jgi:hypothetical protein
VVVPPTVDPFFVYESFHETVKAALDASTYEALCELNERKCRMSEPEPLTLAELQLAKDVQESKAASLRTAMHELRRARPDGWQAEFARVQDELIAAATRIGELNLRIHKLVAGEEGPWLI